MAFEWVWGPCCLGMLEALWRVGQPPNSPLDLPSHTGQCLLECGRGVERPAVHSILYVRKAPLIPAAVVVVAEQPHALRHCCKGAHVCSRLAAEVRLRNRNASSMRCCQEAEGCIGNELCSRLKALTGKKHI